MDLLKLLSSMPLVDHMKNNILSKEEILKLVSEIPDNFTQVLGAKKYSSLYENTFRFVNQNYGGNKFSEKLYKHIYGSKNCKKC